MIAACASIRCHCGEHDIGLACPSWLHDAYRHDRARLVRECMFVGVQHEDGYPDIELWNCHCFGTFCVEVES